jgi:hypothetical protein
MTKKTASKTSAKPAARAPRASGSAAAARSAGSGGAGRDGRASTPPSGAARAKTSVSRTAASKSKSPASKKPAARAIAKATPATKPAAPASARAEAHEDAPATLDTPTPTPAPAREADALRTDVPRTDVPRSGGGGAGDLADRIVEASDTSSVASHAEHLMSDKPTSATASARVLEELLARKPEMLVPVIDKMVHVVTTGPKRSVQTAAAALPVMARLAPARVARHLPMLTDRFAQSSEVGKDGLVSTFAALCTASVAYQKRLEPVLELALSSADPKTLQRWTEIVLPSLKGEPHARARAVVEERLNVIPRQLAQPIATFLGIKLRPASR